MILNFLLTWPKGSQGELIVCPSSCCCVCVFTLSNMNICATRRLNAIIFYLKHQKHHRDWGKAALGFGPVRIRTLVFMATDSPIGL